MCGFSHVSLALASKLFTSWSYFISSKSIEFVVLGGASNLMNPHLFSSDIEILYIDIHRSIIRYYAHVIFA